MGLLSPDWASNLTAKQFADVLDEWDTEVELYEKQTSEILASPVIVSLEGVSVLLTLKPAEESSNKCEDPGG